MAYNFLMPSQIISGEDALNNAVSIIETFGKKALIVTDETMVKLKNVEKLESLLKKINIKYIIYDGINSEPNDQMIAVGKKIYLANKCDFIIGIGGGSPLDSMKAIALSLSSNEHLRTFMNTYFTKKTCMMVAIPTTAGTGSEVTQFTIINDSEKQVKMLLKGSSLIPTLAIIDPIFTMSTPRNVTINTGVDALTHAIEAYTSNKSQPLSNTFALSAIKKIFTNLTICANNPTLQARGEMALAALEAGIAFNNSSVTIVHGMSRPLGAIFHIPHGLSNAVLLKECMQFVVDGAYDKFSEIALYLNLTTSNDPKANSIIFIDYLNNFLNDLNIQTLAGFGINRELYLASIPKMANDAYNSGSPSNTIKHVSIEDMERLYRNLII